MVGTALSSYHRNNSTGDIWCTPCDGAPVVLAEASYAGDTSTDLVTPVGRRMRLDELHAILDRARADGHAENVNETSLGLECMAVPITAAGGATVAAITLCVPSGRIDRGRRRRM